MLPEEAILLKAKGPKGVNVGREKRSKRDVGWLAGNINQTNQW
jgi:hypothetical protein